MVGKNIAEQFGVKLGNIVQEFGYDDDVDEALREHIEQLTGEPFEDEDYRGIADVVLAWWRSDDGNVDDLTDYLMDCAGSLEDGSGVIWCMVPSGHSDYHVSTADVSEAAQLAGQSATTTFAISREWTAIRVVARGR